MIACVSVRVHVFRTLAPPAISCTIDQRIRTLAPVHTIETTANTKPGTAASHARLACASHSACGGCIARSIRRRIPNAPLQDS
jgi:hypothetical protein